MLEYKMRTKKGKEYVKNFIIYELNMDKYKKLWYNKSKKEIEASKYLLMLDMEQEELGKLTDFLDKDKVVEKYMKELKRTIENTMKMNTSIDGIKIENSMKMNASIENEYLEKKHEKWPPDGISEEQIRIAISLLKQDMDKSLIAEVAELPYEEVCKIFMAMIDPVPQLVKRKKEYWNKKK